MRELADDTLVARTREGDPRALAELYRRHAPALLGYLRRLTEDPAEAEDMLQETFLRIFQGRGSYEARGRFRSWLFTIGTRIAFDRRREEKRRRELIAQAMDAPLPSRGEDPEAAVAHRDLLAMVESALADLPPAYAQAFFLRVHEDRSYRDMAAICGDPEGTLRSRVHHAVKQVQRMLRERDMAPESAK